MVIKRFYTRGVGYTEMYAQPALDQNMMNNNMMDMQMAQQQMMYDMNFADGQMPMGMGDFGYQMNGFDVKQEPVDQLQTGTIGTNGSIGTNGALNGQNGVLGQNGALNGQNLPIGPNGTLGAQNGALCLSGQNGALGGPNGALAGQMGSNGAMNSEIQGFEEHGNFVHDVNSVHTKPLDPEYIDQYLEKNKHRIYTCKKCKLNFPHREYLQRHMAYHNDLDNRPYGCGQCPQRFHSPKQLESHQQKHAEDSPHRCQQCAGAFRSALALRRHKDQSRQCYCPPFGVYPQLLSSPTAPLDQYAFIDSDNEADDDSVKGLQLNRQKSTTDSGMGSDSSTHSFTTSPVSTRNNNLDEELDPSHQNSTNQFAQPTQYMMNPPDTIKEDPDGFRSRLNSSTTQSCSPGSSFSGESAGSPSQRKYSNSMGNNGSSMGPHSMGSNGQTQGDYGYHMGYQYPAQYQHGQYQNGATYSPTTYGTNSTYGAQGQDKSRAGFSGLKNAGYTIKNGSFASKKTDFWRKTKDFGTKNDKDTAKTSKKDGNHSSYYLVESTTSIEVTARIAMLSGDDLFNDEDQPTLQAVLFDQIQSKLLAGKATSNMTSQVDMTGNDEEYPGEDLCIDFGGVDVEDEVEKEINKCIRILLTLFLSTAATISRAKTE
ncbi:unnamed protein product [Bursaphelenchus okinawaensis]|uniref:C2H2-type domain-containing protein n=1 Tax=Bursaphelenchus okinawaensis TaxID=465554 RepID=A0A811LLF9_9BILA|nr:unnamed protein product [Bursaphelenchus okinawaensis]CAG9123872.1 unnamed protein product [Bursaphelenchus okinawaensis]